MLPDPSGFSAGEDSPDFAAEFVRQFLKQYTQGLPRDVAHWVRRAHDWLTERLVIRPASIVGPEQQWLPPHAFSQLYFVCDNRDESDWLPCQLLATMAEDRAALEKAAQDGADLVRAALTAVRVEDITLWVARLFGLVADPRDATRGLSRVVQCRGLYEDDWYERDRERRTPFAVEMEFVPREGLRPEKIRVGPMRWWHANQDRAMPPESGWQVQRWVADCLSDRLWGHVGVFELTNSNILGPAV